MQNLPLRLISIVTLITFLFSIVASPVAAAMNYTYDANGSMLSDGTQCYEYTEANQLKTVKRCSNNQTIAEYVYDYQGNRIVKKEYENGTLKNTVYSPDDEFEKKIKASDNSVQNTTYYKTNDEFLARKNPDGSKVYYHNDHLGSNSVLTDQSGNLVEKTAYEPYGEVKSGGTQSKFQYTGQEKDQETGLNYYGARYYSSHIQRFTQADTMLENVYDPQLLNRYSYVRNNPLKYTDPTGRCIGMFTPFCNQIVAFVTKIAQPVINWFTKAQSNPVVQKFEQNVSKTQSNPVVQKAEQNLQNTNSKSTTSIGADSQKYLSNNPQTGWSVTDPINNYTRQGNTPSWSAVRQRFWKNEAELNSSQWANKDLERMRKGLAPQKKGTSLELDHWPAQRDGGLFEFNILDRATHQLIEAERRAEGLY